MGKLNGLQEHMSDNIRTMGKTISNTIGIGSGGSKRKTRIRHIPYLNQNIQFETADPAGLKVRDK